ncbi:hypothetical protein [Marinobacter sp.]|uniref:hypothetical protein n=1 Tax=Marinobacter sp. TaxID=50741 RepID=UPI000C952C7A|nr:hypothetical protein [Marinobacter sp.]MAB53548.1 hypothetical protein [Marinobacter sp.]
MKYFKPDEFGGDFDLLSHDLKYKLDQFREAWGEPVMVSPAPGAVARRLGYDSKSQHNIDRWGECRAVDVMPFEMNTVADRVRAFNLSVQVGFTGIGIAPVWQPRPGMHLDVRKDRTPGKPAKWGYARRDGRQVIVAIDEVLK